MVRPALSDEEKRKLIGARFDPEARKSIEAQAAAHGRSVNAEVEALATAFLDCDDATVALLRSIANEIAGFQKATKKRWHKDVATWAAVAHMMRTGPIMDARPYNPYEDEGVLAAFEEWQRLLEVRRGLIDEMRKLGIAVLEEAPTQKESAGLGGVLADLVVPNPRAHERRAIDGIEEEALRKAATDLFAQILDLDGQIAAAKEKWGSLMQEHSDEERKGRSSSRRRQQEQAQKRWAAGEPFNMDHFVGADPWRFVSND